MSNSSTKRKSKKQAIITEDFIPRHSDRWSREEAYSYYVKREEKTTLKEMVELSGHCRTTIGIWSTNDNWVSDRKVFHRKIPEKWTVAECRDHYVRSQEPVTLRQLQELSGVSLSTLGNYSSKDKWGKQRTEYQYQVRKQADERHAETQSRKRADENRKIAKNVFNGHRSFADVAAIWLQTKQKKLLEAIEKGDQSRVEIELADLNADEVNKWSNIYTRHAKAAIEVYGVLYTTNHDAAIALLDREGFGIREKTYLAGIEKRIAQLGQDPSSLEEENTDLESDEDNTSFVNGVDSVDEEDESKLPGTVY